MRRPLLFFFSVGAALAFLGSACRSRPSTGRTGRSGSAEAMADRPEVSSTLNEVDNWIVRVTSEAAPSNRERVEVMGENLRSYEDKVKAELPRKAGERVDEKAIARDLADLRNAYDHSVASLPVERRAAETALGEALSDVGDRLAQFRVAVASAGVQGNAEIKRRLGELEIGRREIGDTLADLRRASTDTWAEQHRRWELELRRWNEQFQEAQTRLPLMPTPEPDTSPTPAPHRRAKKISVEPPAENAAH